MNQDSNFASELQDVNEKYNISRYCQQLWRFRHFIIKNGQARTITRNLTFRLGHLWFLLRPLLDLSVYGLIFGVILQTSRGVENFLAFLIVGVGYFMPLNTSLNDPTSLLKTYKNLIRSFNFPTGCIVISAWLTTMLSALPAIAIMSLGGWIASGCSDLFPEILLLPLLWLLISLFCLGLYFLVSFITHYLPDVKMGISTISRIWFYISGVFFSLDKFSTDSLIRRISNYNPAYHVLSIARDILLNGKAGSGYSWCYLIVVSSFLLLIGFNLFRKHEGEYAS